MVREKKSVWNRKKYKRAVNKLIRTFNKDIENDWLWNGRFVISQDWSLFCPFEDKSGAQYYVGVVIIDKKTGYKEYGCFDNFSIEWEMWEWANHCITEHWAVQNEIPNPNEQARLEGREPPVWPN